MMKREPPGGRSNAPDAPLSGRDLFGEMFDSGVRLSEIYRRELEALMRRAATPPRRE
jgi:hypothetical protein